MEYFAGCNVNINRGANEFEPVGTASAMHNCGDCERLERCKLKQVAEVFPYDEVIAKRMNLDFNRMIAQERGDPLLFDIWSEGYCATGNNSMATCWAKGIEAKSFKEACDILASQNPEFTKYYDSEKGTYWGCRLFDNEIEARKNFG